MRGASAPDPDEEGRTKLSHYTLLRFLGSGRFAEVAAYRSEAFGSVAMKMCSRESHLQGVSKSAVQELRVLQELQHPNVLRLLDAFAFGDRLHMVLELCDFSLKDLVDARVALPEGAVKSIMQQLFSGLAHVHARRYMHRDIKTENILVAGGGVCKLADFGAAAPTMSALGEGRAAPRALFPGVVTLWYRAPELLMRAGTHGPAVDAWSMGCVLAELVLGQVIFRGGPRVEGSAASEEEGQLAAIARLLGAPCDPSTDAAGARRALAAAGLRQGDVDALALPSGEARLRGLSAPLPLWPGCSALPGCPTFPEGGCTPQAWRGMHAALQAVTSPCVDLLSRLLVWDPALRLTAEEALAHPWFSAQPPPCQPRDLPRPS